MSFPDFRMGLGIDVHRFGDGDHFTLGGVRINYSQGIVAHSDGDVLIHALCDALLGALGLGDIGQHFPDTDPQFANIDSQLLLAEVVRLISVQGYTVVNIDATVLLERPKIAVYIPQMQETLAKWLDISRERVSIKATTTEKLGFVGRGEGIEVHCVALLAR